MMIMIMNMNASSKLAPKCRFAIRSISRENEFCNIHGLFNKICNQHKQNSNHFLLFIIFTKFKIGRE